MNFNSMETAIGNLRWKRFEERKLTYSLISSRLEDNGQSMLDIPSYEGSAANFLPSDDLLRQCFLSSFLVNELSYISSIQTIDTGDTLSFDHTYKIASNVGHLRLDNRWVCQYDSVFLVMNKKGQIISWQFKDQQFFTS